MGVSGVNSHSNVKYTKMEELIKDKNDADKIRLFTEIDLSDGNPDNGLTEEQLQQFNDAVAKQAAETRQKSMEIRRQKAHKAIMEQTKDLKPYDNNGRVNGSIMAKVIGIIDNNVVRRGNRNWINDVKSAFEEIIGKENVCHTDVWNGGGYDFHLNGKNPNKKSLVSCFRDGKEEITVTHPDGTVEKFKLDGTKVE